MYLQRGFLTSALVGLAVVPSCMHSIRHSEELLRENFWESAKGACSKQKDLSQLEGISEPRRKAKAVGGRRELGGR